MKKKYTLLLIIPIFTTIGSAHGKDKCCVVRAIVCGGGLKLCTPRISAFGDVPAAKGDRFERGTGNCGWTTGPFGIPRGCGQPPLSPMCE